VLRSDDRTRGREKTQGGKEKKKSLPACLGRGPWRKEKKRRKEKKLEASRAALGKKKTGRHFLGKKNVHARPPRMKGEERAEPVRSALFRNEGEEKRKEKRGRKRRLHLV